MHRVYIVLSLFITSFLYAQDDGVFTNNISEEDSVTIANWRIKMAQNINPNPDSAFFYSRKIKRLTVERKYGPGIIDADYLIGQCFKRMQQNDSAIVYFKGALEMAEKIDYPIGAARAYNSLCRTYYLMGKMEESIEACEKAIATTLTYDDPNNMIFADSHTALATAYARQNKLDEAIKKLLVVDSVHKLEALRPDVIAAAYQNLGNIYLDLEDYNASEKYYLRANREFEKLGGNATYYLNTTHINLGQVYLNKNNLNKADSLLSLSYEFFSAIKDERTVGEISTYLGQLKMKQNKSAEAETFFNEGFDIHKRNNRTYEASLNALELAKLALRQQQTSRAISYLKEAEDLNRSSKNSQVALETYNLLSRSYAQNNNYRRAFNYKEMAAALKDSLQGIQSSEKIKEIEAIYQTESRDREIALLTSQKQLVEAQKKNQRNVLLGGLGLMTLAGLFFFFQYRNRIRTNSKLKELDKAKSTFFANISHEFRTPLTLIKGPVEDQLDSEALTKNDRKNLLIARANTQRLESLVEQLLALSKLESGNLMLKVQPGNLSGFIAAQAEAFSFSSKEKNINLEISLDSKNEETEWFDRDAMEKILFNLLGNAIKYTNEGGRIRVSGAREQEHYMFHVENTGNFLSEGQQARIFERFYQSDSENPGTGIGLALTKELVDLHKGTISVESAEGDLTRFSVRIPINRSVYSEAEILSEELQKSETTVETVSEAIAEQQFTTPEDAPILLVADDNAEIRHYVSSIFESTYQIKTARNGKEALELALEEIPDIVISDIMMPELDGLGFTEKLKENEFTSHIPIILLTAKSDDKDKLDGVHSGADTYITKPFNAQLLKATVSNLIENRRKLQSRFAQEVLLRPKDIAISSADEQFLERLQKVMDEYLTNPDFSVEQFSKEMGVSRMQLHRKLKAITGQATSEFLRSQRLKLALNLLKEKKATISEIGYTVGFNDPSYFTKCFKQEFGTSPSDYFSS
ncbi:MAG: response regulator [Flavobacteriaceae bacterium]|nr:response regulator [Flavobacteriaceae bacterium]NNJ82102.1 response regulator [Flavobacteriaceae bacterium]NNK53222.1 response regulator [Flavobacteriaceae bacterium]NNM09436.1 response regulator [Flavobacteriaceae bacterium]